MLLRKLISISFVAAGSMLCLFAQTSTTGTRTITLPPAGLGSTETAQINIVNVAANSSTGTAASCTGTISFLNSAGSTMGSATAFTLSSGQLTSASLPFSSAGLSGVRGEIRAQIALSISAGVPCARRSL